MTTETPMTKPRRHSMVIRGERDPRPVSRIMLFTSRRDHGPCEPGSPSALCPHCGSGGRHVWGFVCEDGTNRGAMRGCLTLFPTTMLATQQMAAIERAREARDARRKPTSWDTEVEIATENLNTGAIQLDEAVSIIQAALETRKRWLSRRFPRR